MKSSGTAVSRVLNPATSADSPLSDRLTPQLFRMSINQVPHQSTRRFRRFRRHLFLVRKVRCGMYWVVDERFDFINGWRGMSPVTVKTIKEFSQVMKFEAFKESDLNMSRITSECRQSAMSKTSSLRPYCWFIFETGSRPEISSLISSLICSTLPAFGLGIHGTDCRTPDAISLLIKSIRTRVSPTRQSEKSPLRAPHSPPDWPSRKRDNYLPEQ